MSRSVHMVRNPRGRYIVSPLLSLEAATRNKTKNEDVIRMQESTYKVRKSASQVGLSKMQRTLLATRRTPHGASRLVHAVSAWSVKTRRALS